MEALILAKKYYVVWAGRQTGVFTEWPTAQGHVHGFPGARFKSFESRAEAEEAFKAGTPPSAGKRIARDAGSSAPSRALPVDAEGLHIYCDGACDPNPGHAGSGIAVYRDGQLVELWYGLYNPNGTNNTAELNALHRALLMAEPDIAAGRSVQILCDSSYAINCISKWADGWKAKGWRKPGGEIKNLGIIQDAHAVYTRIAGGIRLTHVSAHVGTEGNELADRMAMYAVTQRDKELRRYIEAIDVKAILRMRAG
ncbi:MAG TPA: ribonuclease H family protein [Steroidobacteraceae bacterium]